MDEQIWYINIVDFPCIKTTTEEMLYATTWASLENLIAKYLKLDCKSHMHDSFILNTSMGKLVHGCQVSRELGMEK
jgi:hypothetical protein